MCVERNVPMRLVCLGPLCERESRLYTVAAGVRAECAAYVQSTSYAITRIPFSPHLSLFASSHHTATEGPASLRAAAVGRGV